MIYYFSSIIYEEKNYKCKFFKFNYNLKRSAFIEVFQFMFFFVNSKKSCRKNRSAVSEFITKALIIAVSPRCFSV